MAAAAFVCQQSRNRLRRESIAGNPVDRVGGHDDALTGTKGREGCSKSIGPGFWVRRINDEGAHALSLVREPARAWGLGLSHHAVYLRHGQRPL